VIADGEVIASKTLGGAFLALNGPGGFPLPRRVLDVLRERLGGAPRG
jgi:hypothetical protein